MRGRRMSLPCLFGIVAFLVVALLMYPLTVKRSSHMGEWGTCGLNISLLGRSLLLYAKGHGGVIPARMAGGDECLRREWISTILPWWESKGHRRLDQSVLKCVRDRTRCTISYTLNPELAGKDLRSIPESAQAKTVLLKEKSFPGSHGSVFFLDGHVGQDGKDYLHPY